MKLTITLSGPGVSSSEVLEKHERLYFKQTKSRVKNQRGGFLGKKIQTARLVKRAELVEAKHPRLSIRRQCQRRH